MSPEQVERWREEFPILDTCVYLINNSLGAMPRSTHGNLQEYALTWAERGVRAWEEEWWALPRTVGDILAGIIGAGPDQVSLHQNVTIAEWIVFSCFQPTPARRKIVYSSLNFPSIRYFYQADPNLEIEVVPSPDGVSVPLDAMLAAIDERTLLVPISHVIFKSGFIQDADAIIRKAHQVGALVILDTYQSCGAIPFDVARLKVDFVVGGSVKWLCGGPGVAYLYVRPDLARRLTPSLTGWMAHCRPFDFEPTMEFAGSSYRFLNGTPNIPGLYAARAGYEIIAEVGVEAIRQRSLLLTQRIIDWADEFGIPVASPRTLESRGGHVTLNPVGAAQLSRKLLDRGFVIDCRPDAGIRVAPHFYNTEAEIDLFMRELRTLIRGQGQ